MPDLVVAQGQGRDARLSISQAGLHKVRRQEIGGARSDMPEREPGAWGVLLVLVLVLCCC
jgi:hypothetical protein